jgi:6-phosphogluconolactonase
MQLNISKNIEELSHKVAEWMVKYIDGVLKKKDCLSIALTGGNTPKKLYSLLATDEFKKKIDWQKLHVFWGDERFVPFNDERNNAKMTFDFLLNHVPVPKSQIHVMKTDIGPQASAKEYEKILHQYFGSSVSQTPLITFDLVLLGLGDNAHTLSLFPGYDLVDEKTKWVRSFFLKEQNMYRITLTAPVVNMASRIAFLISGTDKAYAVKNVLEEKYDPEKYPAQIIQPLNGELFWFADEASMNELKNGERV